ncbi:unnamed protein product [Meloidogyne enterolobii]|uniref:Uncharacterized protein n=1 Tax=Meloidogyne enterolobii TaxID=390850 RepID=A0ACB0YSR6_MELEN
MALRGIRVYGSSSSTQNSGEYSVLLEATLNEKYILCQSGGMDEISRELANLLKSGGSYQMILDGFASLGILQLGAVDDYLVLITGVLSVGQIYTSDIFKISNVKFVSLIRRETEPSDQRIIELQRFLSSGNFYFSNSTVRDKTFDLTVSAQRKQTSEQMEDDFRFFWNRNLSFPLERFGIDPNDWIVRCLCGSVLIRTIYLGHRTAKIMLISRLSFEHVGTRFNVRGINDDGNVANFVETEQIVTFDKQECSFLQIRGSIPLFWEQPGINVGAHTVKMKPLELSLVALEKHFIQLKRVYGKILVVNLLGSKKGEFALSTAFQSALKSSSHFDVKIVSFDYHAEVKQSKENLRFLVKQISSFFDENDFFYLDDGVVLRKQHGVIRTNCLDNLDRTNSVQTLIGIRALFNQLTCLGVEKFKSNIILRCEELVRDMWQKNGDQCSLIYAGTGALEGKSKLRDASRSIVRTIQNNLMDSSKQEAFDLILYGHLLADSNFVKISQIFPSSLLKECPNLEAFVEREKEFCVQIPLNIFCGTWNVNGGKNLNNVAFKGGNLLNSWIFPENLFNKEALNYDLIAIGFEEIVDLNTNNLVKASTTNQRIWRDGLKQTIEIWQKNNFGSNAENFVVLCCEQLVGVCLILFARSSLLNSIKDLAIEEIKTGMGGTTGNKGSIAVRLTINSTGICFACSHFAAGQNEIAARNADFHSALKRLKFPMGRGLQDHDVVFWLGDFNYRISLSGDEVKRAINLNNFEYIAEYDQLLQQKNMGNAFTNFNEGQLNFPPTYKYDTFSDDYDTSDKTPAWTDRVLWMDKNNLVQLIHYGRSELKTSDHRPVYAIFQLNSLKFDFDKAEPIIRDIICSIGPPHSCVQCFISNNSLNVFPKQLCNEIFMKLCELGSVPKLSKLEGQYLFIIFKTGLDALAALSMDGINLSTGQELKVELKNEGRGGKGGIEWSEKIIESVNKALEKAKKEEKEYLINKKINNDNNKLLDGEEILIDDEDDLAGEGMMIPIPARY